MKRITLFLTVCLGLSVFQTASAVDSETARAANKRTSVNTITTNNSVTRGNTSNTKQKSDTNRNENARTVVNKNTHQSTTVKTRTAANQHVVKQRSATSSQQKNIVSRTNAIQRTVSASRSATRRPVSGKIATARTATTSQKTNRVARAVALDNEKIAEIKSKDYSKCKTVFQECMDEFCANKDTTLRRCACSSRVNEFDKIKKQLTNAEDKMVSFNQRLLTVGMDKEDALSINTATEGELAFSQPDKSESEKLLKKITNTLNSSGDSKLTNNLASVSLDLDMESAWDTVDATAGISTTAKSGLGLYNAALPVCIEMANEVCNTEELDIAERNYKLAIQNDCNTVSTAYGTQYNKALEKIHESSALLDMARLNAHQQRNSDDILTCKKKMLEQLSDSSVCGEKLYKCLDITGQYIDPSTGEAFLSPTLSNLTTLLTAPTGDTTWSKVSNNKEFVNFLNSKKMFLKPATEQCQDLADVVWNDFIEDALAQIKLEQNAKLEDIRRSCVTLIAECRSNINKSLEDFDVRSLSIFAISADTTANTVCNDVQESCLALVDSEGWQAGLKGISSDISTENMFENCMMVGKTCFLQKCSGLNGDFTLCNRTNDPMRFSILNRSVCWQDVVDCVAQASNINYDTSDAPSENQNYLSCDSLTSTIKLEVCEVAHKIWGNCTDLETEGDNTIYPKIDQNPYYKSSLLSWFSTQTNNNSCSSSVCGDGFDVSQCSGTCKRNISTTQGVDDNHTSNLFAITYQAFHGANSIIPEFITEDYKIDMEQLTNDADDADKWHIQTLANKFAFCPNGCKQKDKFGNCCLQSIDNNRICVPTGLTATLVQTVECNGINSYYCADSADYADPKKEISLYCMNDYGPSYNGTDIECPNGIWVLIDSYGNYFSPATTNGTSYSSIYEYGQKGVIMAAREYKPNSYTGSDIIEYRHPKWKVKKSIGGYIPIGFGPAKYLQGQHFYIDYTLP